MQIPPDTLSLGDYERHFHARVEPAIRAYIAGAAADGITQRENGAAFQRLRLMPRALVELSGASAQQTLFGETLACVLTVIHVRVSEAACTVASSPSGCTSL